MATDPRTFPGDADLIPVGRAPLPGRVVEFDDPRGIGVVRCGDRTFPFHCTAITDGSRTIGVGTEVTVGIGAGRLGRLEARSLRPVPGPVAPATVATEDTEENPAQVSGASAPTASASGMADTRPPVAVTGRVEAEATDQSGVCLLYTSDAADE